eukprot:155875-Chlamydomonas_euryale.AAC.3
MLMLPLQAAAAGKPRRRNGRVARIAANHFASFKAAAFAFDLAARSRRICGSGLLVRERRRGAAAPIDSPLSAVHSAADTSFALSAAAIAAAAAATFAIAAAAIATAAIAAAAIATAAAISAAAAAAAACVVHQPRRPRRRSQACRKHLCRRSRVAAVRLRNTECATGSGGSSGGL